MSEKARLALQLPAVSLIAETDPLIGERFFFDPKLYTLIDEKGVGAGVVPGHLIGPQYAGRGVPWNDLYQLALARFVSLAKEKGIAEKDVTRAVHQGRFAPAFWDFLLAGYGISIEERNERFGYLRDLPALPTMLEDTPEVLSGNDIIVRNLSNGSSTIIDAVGITDRKITYTALLSQLRPNLHSSLDEQMSRFNRIRSPWSWYGFWTHNASQARIYRYRAAYESLRRRAARVDASFGSLLGTSQSVAAYANERKARAAGEPWCASGGVAHVALGYWLSAEDLLFDKAEVIVQSLVPAVQRTGCTPHAIVADQYAPGWIDGTVNRFLALLSETGEKWNTYLLPYLTTSVMFSIKELRATGSFTSGSPKNLGQWNGVPASQARNMYLRRLDAELKRLDAELKQHTDRITELKEQLRAIDDFLAERSKHLDLSDPDVEKALRFYEEVTGERVNREDIRAKRIVLTRVMTAFEDMKRGNCSVESPKQCAGLKR